MTRECIRCENPIDWMVARRVLGNRAFGEDEDLFPFPDDDTPEVCHRCYGYAFETVVGWNIDWDELREQKQRLLNAPEVDLEVQDAIDGVIGLIDFLQDAAALRLGETAVFGPPTEEE